MQCFRCGTSIAVYTCAGCGEALNFGEDVCSHCDTPVLCAECADGTAFPAGDRSIESEPVAVEPGLQYEYTQVQIPVPMREHDESTAHYAQRVHRFLTEQTLSAALEGWQTVDPLEYSWLERNGLVDHGLLHLGRPRVTVRLKRLAGGPPDATSS